MSSTFTIGGKSYTLGDKLNSKELAEIAKKSDRTVASIAEKAKQQGFGLSEGVKTTIKTPVTPVNPETPVTPNLNQAQGTIPISNTTEIGMTAEQASDYNYRSGLLTLQNNLDQELENLRGAWSLKSTDISTARELEARKYVADREGLTQENVERIKGSNDIDLRKLIEAGETERENIRGAVSRDVERIQGEYNIQGENIRQAGQQRTADIQKAGTMYGSLINAFSF